MSLIGANKNEGSGVLSDFRNHRRGLSFGVSMILWLFVGGGIGGLVGRFLVDAELGVTLGVVGGALIGLGVGCFAAFGRSPLARILDAPGTLLALLPF